MAVHITYVCKSGHKPNAYTVQWDIDVCYFATSMGDVLKGKYCAFCTAAILFLMSRHDAFCTRSMRAPLRVHIYSLTYVLTQTFHLLFNHNEVLHDMIKSMWTPLVHKKTFSEFGVEKLDWPYTALTSPPSNIFGMNRIVDCDQWPKLTAAVVTEC